MERSEGAEGLWFRLIKISAGIRDREVESMNWKTNDPKFPASSTIRIGPPGTADVETGWLSLPRRRPRLKSSQ